MKYSLFFRCAIVAVVLSILACFQFPNRLHAQNDSIKVAPTYQQTELILQSTKTYTRPVADIDVSCIWQHTSGRTITVKGFWNGSAEYRVRFAAPLAGVWTYRTVASDTTNNGLDSRRGSITIQPYRGDNALYSKGFLTVSENKRYLTYGTGEPFFWLGDTMWDITWKSRLGEAKRLISDRKQKQFSVAQVIPMTYIFYPGRGITNRNNQNYYLDNDYLKPNPRYFDYLDSLVQTMNDSNIVVALVPLWGAFSNVSSLNYAVEKLTREQALIIAGYIGARYAGAHVAWIIGGDDKYGSPAQQEFWATFGRTVKNASGNQHITTVHPIGYGTPNEYFANTTDWIDFNMYQSSHVAKGDFTWQEARRQYDLRPAKPTVNGEPCYEDIFHNLWNPGDTTRVETFRIRAEHVRQAVYESFLSGTIAGVTYGANGAWQWHSAELPGTFQPRVYWDSAMKFPGSTQMMIFKEWMTRLQWYKFLPATERVMRFTSEDNHIAAAILGDSNFVAYLPMTTRSVTLNLNGVGSANSPLQAFWVCPASGKVEKRESVSRTAETLVTSPSQADWLLVITENTMLSVFEPNISRPNTTQLSVTNIFPQPALGSLTMVVDSEEFGVLDLSVFDMAGRLLSNTSVSISSGKTPIPLRFRQTGAMVYRGVFTSTSCQQNSVSGTLFNIGKD